MKRLLHCLGCALCVTGVVFVVLRLKTYSHQVDISIFDATAWTIIGLFALIYGAANALLARAWWHILNFLKVNTDWKWAIKTYGLSQLAKYVPGNIFHLAGRQALGMAAGFKAPPLVKSAVWELGLIAVAGTIYGLLAVPLLFPDLSLWISFALFVVISVLLVVTLCPLLSPSIGVALIWQMTFLAISGTVFIATLSAVTPTTIGLVGLPAFCGAYVIAWLAGLLTPGAPAGVGVREMVLLFLLGGRIEQADLLLAVVLGRLVTVIGDLLFFFVSTALKAPLNSNDTVKTL
ncbi:hypothetical protein [Desulfatitalea alkaliphila]|uniref:Lysylphosphatidylglycerol synthase TM region n=1 Tax=Desulfatitalea alkaliphila TaxID=2929485 RepID=A0AA41UJY7_9BACT|nr:hypothetical protein [Desulfatitalea alkaliphila]MCJ8502470.1 hypothetical protein [Desulfatitalea alkaliphila]